MRLCSLTELKQRITLEVRLGEGGEEGGAFVVYRNGEVRAYLNQCPHTGAPLNWSPHVFLSAEGDFIQCSLHGAMFQIDDGYCVYGPCSGKGLQAVSVEVVGDDILLKTASIPE